jgi:TetR/AcrR family fatty acid metabolism transcriptional regulator
MSARPIDPGQGARAAANADRVEKLSLVIQNRVQLRKEEIIKAAERVFARKGLHEATISEIANQAGVSEGTIYEHFSTKDNLLFSIPELFTRNMGEFGKFHLRLIRGAANKLRAYIYLYMWVMQENPDYAIVSLLHLKGNLKFRKTEGFRLVRQWYRLAADIIAEGVESGEFRDDVDPYIIRSILMGAADQVTANWLLSDRKRDLLDAVDPIFDTIMEGVLGKTPPSSAKWSAARRREPLGPIPEMPAAKST